MRKEMVFVMGPESGGTRGTTKLLIENGYWGTNAHIQILDEFVYGRRNIDNIVPPDINKIVLRRSIPHAKEFPDVHTIDTLFLNSGYKTKWLVVIRDLAELARSKVARKHSIDLNQATHDIMYQYTWIFEKLSMKTSGVYFFPFTYYIKNPQKALEILKSFEII
ncbi:MAG: hypothetical protein ACFFG0_04205 [Candidatus Thorarchaeota archaeon]